MFDICTIRYKRSFSCKMLHVQFTFSSRVNIRIYSSSGWPNVLSNETNGNAFIESGLWAQKRRTVDPKTYTVLDGISNDCLQSCIK
jgi:hypothetical protein